MKDVESFTPRLVTQGIKDAGKFHPENMPLIHKSSMAICWSICLFEPTWCPEDWVSTSFVLLTLVDVFEYQYPHRRAVSAYRGLALKY